MGASGNNKKDIKWLSWENMSMGKNEGGLGYRDLYGFNIALLAKHCWTFLNKPHTYSHSSSLQGEVFSQ